MAFKIKPPFPIDNTPIYTVDLEEGVVGKADRNGSILIDKDVQPKEQHRVITHEKVHLDQMKRGDLDYDDNYVYWKGKKYSRADMEEGSPNLAWEAEAWSKTPK